jgi:pyruvate/2-oxoglutarate dehydrogenase complex dihydrolipoamide acyltransferase (E2) component
MTTPILMPALSPTMEEGKLAKWHVKPGDKVRSGDVIAEIETDKATMEVEAVDEGVVETLLVPEGTEAVKVNTVIAQLREEGAVAAPATAKPATAAPAPAPVAAKPSAAPVAPTKSPAGAPAIRAPEGARVMPRRSRGGLRPKAGSSLPASPDQARMVAS